MINLRGKPRWSWNVVDSLSDKRIPSSIQLIFVEDLQCANTCWAHSSTIRCHASIALQWRSFLGFVMYRALHICNDSHWKSTFAHIEDLQIPEKCKLSITYNSLARLSRKQSQLEPSLLEASCLLLFSDCGALRLSELQLFPVASKELDLDGSHQHGFRWWCKNLRDLGSYRRPHRDPERSFVGGAGGWSLPGCTGDSWWCGWRQRHYLVFGLQRLKIFIYDNKTFKVT